MCLWRHALMSVDRSAGCICWIAWSGVNGMSSQTCSLHLCVTLSSLRTTHPLVFLVVHTGLRVRARHENFRHAMILRRTFTDAVLGTLISPPRWARSYLRRATSHCCCSFFLFSSCVAAVSEDEFCVPIRGIETSDVHSAYGDSSAGNHR